MKALILHLSDIHIKTESDQVLTRTQQIVDSIKNIESELDAVICVLSGDIVFSATDDQYMLALEFVSSLTDLLDNAFHPLKAQFVTVPGNHDCDFKDSMAVRESVLPDVLKQPALLCEASYSSICLDPLKRFFDFQSAIDTLPLAQTVQVDSGFFRELHVVVGTERISFMCFNSAATSKLHEQPGSLVFPTQLIPNAKKSTGAAVISVYHHPTNWMEPTCAREFRTRVESMSDIILTGHEHVIDRRDVTSKQGNAIYIEGGALQDSEDPATSEFNVLVLDTTDRKMRLIGFEWRDEAYLPQSNSNTDQYHEWEDFSQNSFRVSQTFQLLPNFSARLEDLEITLTHRVKGQLQLSDVYVFPDLKRFNQAGDKVRKVIRGENIPDLVMKQSCLFIFGDDQSGKTALAKRLFSHLREKGDIPILIDASTQPLSVKKCAKNIEDAFLKNYEPGSVNAFRQSDRSKRVLIIDNYHRAKVAPRERNLLLTALKQQSYRVIAFADETALTLQELSESVVVSTGETPFEYYNIRQFSYTQQSKLIEKWLLLNGDAAHDTAPFIANLDRIRKAMDTVFGKNYMPAYPPYLLAILQATEAGTELDLKANTHGYFYELFIKQSIAKHSPTPAMVSILTTYLSHVAFWMFNEGQRLLAETQLRKLHATLQEKIEVLNDFDVQIERLVKMQLLDRRNDGLAFRQPYIYYYFLSLYFHNHIDDQAVAAAIDRLSNELYLEESASTLLFLAHHSKDRRILDTLLAACEAQYIETPPAILGDDVRFLNDLNGKIENVVIPSLSITELREQELERLDIQRQDEDEFEETNRRELEAHNTLLGKLNAALKTIQILGQFLKN